MDHNEIQNENIQKALINVEALQKEYDNTLQQYLEAVKNYILTALAAAQLMASGNKVAAATPQAPALGRQAPTPAKTGTGATTIAVSGSTVNSQATIAHRFNLGGTLISHVTSSNGRQGIFPGADSTFDLGGPSVRWAHIYTGDLHLRNERGDYTLIEEPDFLSVRFNKNGKRYKFLLERVPELDETR